MKSIIGFSGFAVLVFLLHSCTINQPITTSAPKNNDTYVVDYLFEHDGCKVYRFSDGSRTVYFTNCSGDVTSFENDSVGTRNVNMVRKSPATYKAQTPSNNRR